MNLNVGSWDRAIRMVAGLTVIVLSLTGVLWGWLAIAGYVVGGVLILTGIVGYCPANALLGVNTRKMEPPEPGTE